MREEHRRLNVPVEELGYREICRITEVLGASGVRKVRFTGREPLLRGDIVDLVRYAKSVDGIETVVLTTNGIRLDRCLDGLLDADLDGINFSLDTFNGECYRFLFGRIWQKDGRLLCKVTRKIESHMITSLLGANCLMDASGIGVVSSVRHGRYLYNFYPGVLLMSSRKTIAITVKCFASAREVLARDEFHMDVPEGSTIEVVEQEIRKLSSQLAEMPFMLALNMEYPAEGTLVRKGDELAIIPPVS